MKRYNAYVQEIQNVFIQYNIQRVAITACVIIVLQLYPLLEQRLFLHPFYLIGFISLSLISLCYLIFVYFFYTHWVHYAKKSIYLSFWILLCLAFIPYIIMDLQTSHVPLYMTLCYGMLMAVPILTTKELIWMFSSFGLLNIYLCYLYKGKASVYVLIIILSITGYCFAYIIQNQYTHLIYRLKYESDTDYLTNILNRKGGLEKVKDLLHTCKRHETFLGICMIDIDYFKDFNDRYGHLQGDIALQNVARAIRCTLKRQNDIVCRIGGEEFLVCFTCKSTKDIDNMAEKLRQAIYNLKILCAFHHTTQYLTISIGTSAYIPGVSDIHDDELKIIKEADDALYHAKRSGRNQVCHNYYQGKEDYF